MYCTKNKDTCVWSSSFNSTWITLQIYNTFSTNISQLYTEWTGRALIHLEQDSYIKTWKFCLKKKFLNNFNMVSQTLVPGSFRIAFVPEQTVGCWPSPYPAECRGRVYTSWQYQVSANTNNHCMTCKHSQLLKTQWMAGSLGVFLFNTGYFWFRQQVWLNSSIQEM